jgi:hypothetical protein
LDWFRKDRPILIVILRISPVLPLIAETLFNESGMAARPSLPNSVPSLEIIDKTSSEVTTLEEISFLSSRTVKYGSLPISRTVSDRYQLGKESSLKPVPRSPGKRSITLFRFLVTLVAFPKSAVSVVAPRKISLLCNRKQFVLSKQMGLF